MTWSKIERLIQVSVVGGVPTAITTTEANTRRARSELGLAVGFWSVAPGGGTTGTMWMGGRLSLNAPFAGSVFRGDGARLGIAMGSPGAAQFPFSLPLKNCPMLPQIRFSGTITPEATSTLTIRFMV